MRPKQGFNQEMINELKNKIKNFSNIERFMMILSGKMKIPENLVESKSSMYKWGFRAINFLSFFRLLIFFFIFLTKIEYL